MREFPEKLLYPHIHKTGGTSLNHLIQLNMGPIAFYLVKDNKNVAELHDNLTADKYLKNYRRWSDIEKKAGREKLDFFNVFGGHCSHGIHILSNKSYSYMTTLREPLDRFVSYYHHHRFAKPRHRKSRLLWEDIQDMEIAEYAQYDPIFTMSDNRIVRVISGKKSVPIVTEKELQLAKKNLKEYKFILFLSHIDVGIKALANYFNWENVDYVKRKVNDKTKTFNNREKMDDRALEMIEPRIKYDNELYNYAKTLPGAFIG